MCIRDSIRGRDLPNSPIANCKIIITKEKQIYFFSNQSKINKIKLSLKKLKIQFLKESSILNCLVRLKNGNFCIDSKSCSVFEESLISYKFKIIDREDPIYDFKSFFVVFIELLKVSSRSKELLFIKNFLTPLIVKPFSLSKNLIIFKNSVYIKPL